MLPTFLLVALVLVLAIASPLIFVGSLILSFAKRWRVLGLRLLLVGALAGVTTVVSWLVLLASLNATDAVSLRGLAVALGCGYSIGALAMSGWLIFRRTPFGARVAQ